MSRGQDTSNSSVWRNEPNGAGGMNDDYEQDGAERPREGLFDAQLSFPAPFSAPPSPFTSIVKRDGAEEPFDQRKIAEAILRAADSVGVADESRASSIAAGVSIYLSKRLNGSLPNVDQVHDAVERVLIELGDADTALAYVRHREKQRRLRQLRDGDTHALIREMAEARGSSQLDLGEDAVGRAPVSVRTSAETVMAWDREMIVKALMRETGMDLGLARVIAYEVENQITSAGVETLTGPLIRELVDAKLLERGLDRFRRRHMRLGVPLFDAEEIICEPNRDHPPGKTTPATTNRALAERVKREYALNHVFSSNVATAHARGDMHIHDLDEVDRIQRLTCSPAWIARYGLGLGSGSRFSEPPVRPEQFIGQLVRLTDRLQQHLSNGVTWDHVNVHLAPFVKPGNRSGANDLMKMLVYEFALRALNGEPFTPAPALRVYWGVPEEMVHAPAIGPRGDYTGLTYGDNEQAAQDLAWSVVETYKDGGRRETPYPAPRLEVVLDDSFFRHENYKPFLLHVAEAAAAHGNIRIRFVHNGERDEAATVWSSHSVSAGAITLNLPRVAFRAESIASFYETLPAVVESVVTGHLSKRDFLRRLLDAREHGPLALLGVRRERRELFSLNDAAFELGVCGIREAAKALEPPDETEFAESTLERLYGVCAEFSERFGMQFVLTETSSPDILRRLAAMDLETFPESASGIAEFDNAACEIRYTSGAAMPKGSGLNAMERVRGDGKFHRWVTGTFTEIALPDFNMSSGSLAAFLEKAFFQSECAGVLLTKEPRSGDGLGPQLFQ